MTQCNINVRDAKQFRDIDGEPNLVARFRRTRKGEVIEVDGVPWGGEGKDGSDYYAIRLGGDGVMYCSCPDYKFRGHASNHKTPGTNYMCKHVRLFLIHAVDMVANGVAMDSECIIYNAAVTEVAIERLGAAAAAGQKISKVKAA